jgi:hypothetical protein
VRGEICSPCCGAEREVTVSCPLDCEYLVEARLHEKPQQIDVEKIAHRDIVVTEEFLDEIEPLVHAVSQMLASAALQTPGAVDRDVQSALDAMIRTYRTRESGLFYESRPDNVVAGMLQQRLQSAIDQYSQALTRERGMTAVRDADVLGALVFLYRVAVNIDNARPRGRSLISILMARYPELGGGSGGQSLLAI